jgi:uncharacterized protein YndB with AHSA1/START domain
MDIYKGNMPERGSHAILLDVYIKAPAAHLFSAISQAEELERWWPKTCEGEARLYAPYRFLFSEEYDWRAEVIDLSADRLFVLRMTEADADWTGTELRFTLEEQADQTLLHFEHVNWPYDNVHFRHSTFCWALLLNGLKQYLEEGRITPFEERA